MTIYADNAATTKISPGALRAMVTGMEELYGNPSSLHALGQRASAALGNARETVASLLGASPREFYFTSGGSEADNQAILSAARAGAAAGKRHLIASAFEHHAVLRTLERLRREGFQVTLLPVHGDGLVRPEELERAITPETALVTIMTVNNEVGTVQPVNELGAICRKRGVVFHTDAVQAAGHIPLRLENLDMLSLSAHKFHGPKGIGGLYVRKGVPLTPLITGGGQERGKRAGTENLPAILGMAAALEECVQTLEQSGAYVAGLRARLLEQLRGIPGCHVNGSPGHQAPGILNLCFDGIEGESLILLLDQRGVCASSGSACTSGALEPSHVLLAMGVPETLARGSLRLSLDADNTPEEIDEIARAVTETVSLLRGMRWGDGI